MSKLNNYLEAAKIYKFPEPKIKNTKDRQVTKEEFQQFVNELIKAFDKYDLIYHPELMNMFLNETFETNGGKK